MNRQILDMLEKRMSGDYRRRDYENDNRDRRDNNDMRDMRDNTRGRDNRDYNDGRNNFYYRDGQDNRDEGYDGRSSDYRRDGEDGRRGDRRDYGNHIRLTKSDMHKWKTSMENSDGTMGPHYDMSQIMQVADKLGIKFQDYDEKEFCIAVNMMYSDYCRTIKKYVSPEKELHMCAELAADFLEDADGPEPSEKLALYYHCIACSE